MPACMSVRDSASRTARVSVGTVAVVAVALEVAEVEVAEALEDGDEAAFVAEYRCKDAMWRWLLSK